MNNCIQDTNLSLTAKLKDTKQTILLVTQHIMELEHDLNVSVAKWEEMEIELNAIKVKCDEQAISLVNAKQQYVELESILSNVHSNSSLFDNVEWPCFSPYNTPSKCIPCCRIIIKTPANLSKVHCKKWPITLAGYRTNQKACLPAWHHSTTAVLFLVWATKKKINTIKYNKIRNNHLR